MSDTPDAEVSAEHDERDRPSDPSARAGDPREPSEYRQEPAKPLVHRIGEWWERASFPVPTLTTFAAFAAVWWLNAAINHYRFNVALAVLASIPLIFLGVRGAGAARREHLRPAGTVEPEPVSRSASDEPPEGHRRDGQDVADDAELRRVDVDARGDREFGPAA